MYNFLLNFLCIVIWTISLMCSSGISQPNSSKSKVEMKIDPASGFLEISNGLLGIVVPWKQEEQKKRFNLAPIQSVIYADGQKSDNTVNYLKAPAAPIAFKASILENTQTKISVLLDYRFNKPKFVYPQQDEYKGGEAGPGYYRCKISVVKNQKSIIILEETDFDISYAFK
ncbi:MAG: hypothetical protein IPL56_00795 [Saprospiraceae bacterium]|nr:hypothetical protein [Saprospiraceae bacterium]